MDNNGSEDKSTPTVESESVVAPEGLPAEELPPCGHAHCANPKEYYTVAEVIAMLDMSPGEFLLTTRRGNMLPAKIDEQWVYRNPAMEEQEPAPEEWKTMSPEEKATALEVCERLSEKRLEAEQHLAEFLCDQLEVYGALPELLHLALWEEKSALHTSISALAQIRSIVFSLAENPEANLTPLQIELIEILECLGNGLSETLDKLRSLNRSQRYSVDADLKIE